MQDTSAAGPASAAGAARRRLRRRRPGAVKPVIRAAAAKRANASVIGMIVALVVSIAAFLPIVLMNPSPKTDGYRPDINVSAVAHNAADVAGFTPAAPDTGDTFRPNYARWESGTRQRRPHLGGRLPHARRSPSSGWCRPGRPIPPGCCSRPRTLR